jgi:hypothetical protein
MGIEYWKAVALFELEELEKAEKQSARPVQETPTLPGIGYGSVRICLNRAGRGWGVSRPRHVQVLAIDTSIQKLRQEFYLDPTPLNVRDKWRDCA